MREEKEALFNTEDAFLVDERLIEELKQRAAASPTGRFRLCLHRSTDEAIQDMLVVHCRKNYSRPHCHPHSAVSLKIIEGEMGVLLFDDQGEIARTVELGTRGGGMAICVRLIPSLWYATVCRSEMVVFYETKQGPFARERSNVWAPWSPDEDDLQGIAAFRAQIGVDSETR
jgi:cupin fold WbuC family metalloprotein